MPFPHPTFHSNGKAFQALDILYIQALMAFRLQRFPVSPFRTSEGPSRARQFLHCRNCRNRTPFLLLPTISPWLSLPQSRQVELSPRYENLRADKLKFHLGPTILEFYDALRSPIDAVA